MLLRLPFGVPLPWNPAESRRRTRAARKSAKEKTLSASCTACPMYSVFIASATQLKKYLSSARAIQQPAIFSRSLL
jgi:hypothetical protein